MSKKRGFGMLSAERRSEIARMGGKAAHKKGTAHQYTPEEARVAGRKGGQNAHAQGVAHKFTTEEARAAGRKGGRASASNKAAARESAADAAGTVDGLSAGHATEERQAGLLESFFEEIGSAPQTPTTPYADHLG